MYMNVHCVSGLTHTVFKSTVHNAYKIYIIIQHKRYYNYSYTDLAWKHIATIIM